MAKKKLYENVQIDYSLYKEIEKFCGKVIVKRQFVMDAIRKAMQVKNEK